MNKEESERDFLILAINMARAINASDADLERHFKKAKQKALELESQVDDFRKLKSINL